MPHLNQQCFSMDAKLSVSVNKIILKLVNMEKLCISLQPSFLRNLILLILQNFANSRSFLDRLYIWSSYARAGMLSCAEFVCMWNILYSSCFDILKLETTSATISSYWCFQTYHDKVLELLYIERTILLHWDRCIHNTGCW